MKFIKQNWMIAVIVKMALGIGYWGGYIKGAEDENFDRYTAQHRLLACQMTAQFIKVGEENGF